MNVPKRFRLYKGEKITIEQELKEKGVDTMKSENPALFKAFTDAGEDRGIFNLPLRDYTKGFCNMSAKGMIEQFRKRKGFFQKKFLFIEDAKVYRFKDKFFPLMIEHNKNDIGFRPLPSDNMWLEVPLQFGDIKIAGIHLLRVFVNENDEFAYQVYPDQLIPAGYDQEAISIFVTGLAKDTVFYNFFLLEKISKYEKIKPMAKYVCPYCNNPMKKLDDSNSYYCDNPECIIRFQGSEKILYDMDNSKTKKVFRVMNMKDVWKIEDRIRLFVSNFLDYLDEPEIRIITSLGGQELKKQNQKRAKRGKSPLPPIKVIEVTGELKRYIKLIGERCRTVDVARNETWVDGHFFRFWSRDKWNRMYEWIKGQKTDGEIRSRLSKLVRKDSDGHPLPSSQQYRWDSRHKVIKVHKRGFIKWKGMGEPVERIKVVDVR